MPNFRVYQIQEEIVLRRWTYEIDADSEAAALELAKTGGAAPEAQGGIGVPEYATSGWSLRHDAPSDDWVEALSSDEDRAWKEALDDYQAQKREM
jgi:hypothetical protein